MSQTELYELRRNQINALQESGLSANAWCKENHVKASTLRYWIHKIHMEDKSTSDETAWVQLTPEQPQSTEKSSPIIVRIGTLTIEVQSNFDRTAFADVIATIQNL